VDKKQKIKFVDELLVEVVEQIEKRSDVYISSNFDLKTGILENECLNEHIEKSINKMLQKRNENAIANSVIDDELYKRLMKGRTIVWSDVTGSVMESGFDVALSVIKDKEGKIVCKMNDEIVELIMSKLAVKNDIINGYLISSAGERQILLPSEIKNLKFYEAEDVYDYMGIEIIDRIKNLFVCISNEGAKVISDTHNKKYIGTLIDANNKDLIGIIESNRDRKEFQAELLIQESQIGK